MSEGYWAAEGRIACNPIEGGVEITAEDYHAALDGMLSGRVVTVAGGFAVIDPPPPPEPEPEPAPPLTLDDFRESVQGHIDATAQARGYDHGVSLASYAASTVPAWAAEAAAFISWRDAVWAYALVELEAVQIGTRARPATTEAFVAELPAITWNSDA